MQRDFYNKILELEQQAQPTAMLPAPASSRETLQLTPALRSVFEAVQREIGMEDQTLIQSELEQLVSSAATQLGLELSKLEKDEILSQIEKEQKPFGALQSLVDNPDVSDIIVTNYSQISVQQGRRTFRTDLQFPSQSSYEAFVEKILQRAGATCSTKKPIADGMIGNFARLHVVHQSICESGPYLTIRLNRFQRVAVEDLVSHGMAPQVVFDYLCKLCHKGNTILLVGEVGTGKTTVARAISSSIPHDESILVIEDTPEIKLDHPQVRYVTTREANTDGEGRIHPNECIRAGMRMAMNRIIFGEIRDAEAAEAFVDVCSSGHPGLSTIHGKSSSKALTRLELFLARAQRGSSRDVLFEQISTAVQIVVFVNICKKTGRRRIFEVKEIGSASDGALRQRDIFCYETVGGEPSWRVASKSSNFRDSLEEGDSPVRLSTLPDKLSLNPALNYKEASTAHTRRWEAA